MSKHNFASPSLIPVAEDRLLTPVQAAERLGLRTETLKKYRKAGSPTVGPKFVRLNDRVIRYKLSDLVAYVSQREMAFPADDDSPLAKIVKYGPGVTKEGGLR